MSSWRDNPHWMVRQDEEPPAHDPPETGCECCGFLGGYGPDGEWDDDLGVEHTDLIWVNDACYSRGPKMWLCMECD